MVKQDDYKTRMVEEFNFVKEKTDKLDKMLRKLKFDKLDFEPTCPEFLLRKQYDAMRVYLECLKERAIIEDIDLKY